MRRPRLTLGSAILIALIHLGTVSLLVLWTDRALDRTTEKMTARTAELLGRELAGAMSDQLFDTLAHGTGPDRARLLRIFFDLARRSEMVESVRVVDAEGEIASSNDFLELGRELPSPRELFGDPEGVVRGELEPRVRPEPEIAGEARRYRVEVPLVHRGQLVGYLALVTAPTDLDQVFGPARRWLFALAVAGLVVIAILGFLLHLQLRRRETLLVRTIEGAISGDPEPLAEHGELDRAFAAAGRLGQALRDERARGSAIRERLSALAHRLEVGVLLLDADRDLELASPRAGELLAGAGDAGEIAARWERVAPALAPAFERLEAGAVEVEEQLELIQENEDGESSKRLLSAQINRLDAGGFLVLIRDRRAVSELELDLRLAAQLRGLNHLYRGVAHDLKAPINAMGLNLQLLSQLIATDRDLEDDKRERLGKYSKVIEGELERLHRSLEVLLAQARPPSEKEERFALQEVIEELEHLLRPQARQQRVELRVELPAETLLLVGQRDQIKQVVLNVAVNALEAMAEQGELTLAVTTEGQEVIVTIDDTGPGIPPEILETIFDMHVTTKKTGSGIGLYVARSIVEGHGGTIGVVSAKGEGTRFEIRLPRFDVEAAKAAIQEVSS